MAAETTSNVQSRQTPKQEVKHEAPADVHVRVTATDHAPSRIGRAEAIIHRNVLWTLGAGVIPIPLIDFVAVTGVQLKMLKELSDLYGVKFSESIVKKLLGTLVSSIGGVALGGMLGASLAKVVPVLGTTLGVISLPIVAGAFTHATGKVFLIHFESGGTVLDFDPHAMRSYFKTEFEKAKETVAKIHEQTKTDPTVEVKVS